MYLNKKQFPVTVTFKKVYQTKYISKSNHWDDVGDHWDDVGYSCDIAEPISKLYMLSIVIASSTFLISTHIAVLLAHVCCNIMKFPLYN